MRKLVVVLALFLVALGFALLVFFGIPADGEAELEILNATGTTIRVELHEDGRRQVLFEALPPDSGFFYREVIGGAWGDHDFGQLLGFEAGGRLVFERDFTLGSVERCVIEMTESALPTERVQCSQTKPYEYPGESWYLIRNGSGERLSLILDGDWEAFPPSAERTVRFTGSGPREFRVVGLDGVREVIRLGGPLFATTAPGPVLLVVR